MASTSFEGVTKRDANRLTLDWPHWFEFQGAGGAEMSIVGDAPHSGASCLQMRLWNAKKSRRNEFCIWPSGMVGNDAFTCSTWLKLPADYGLHVAGINWGWHEFCVLLSEGNAQVGLFYLRLLINQPDITKPVFNLILGGRYPKAGSEGPQFVWARKDGFPLKRGEWFNVRFACERKTAGGRVLVWIDDEPVFDVQNVRTTYNLGDYLITPAKLYFEVNETATVEQRIWCDDVTLESGIAPPPGKVELGETWERESLGNGRYKLTIYNRPIAYDDGGVKRRIANAFEASGVTARPNAVTKAPMLVGVGDDGMRRIHPTREDGRYIEIGAPYVKVGGVWTKVAFSAPVRSDNKLTWSRPEAALSVTMAGHYVKLDLELLGGYVPPDRQLAFPVGLTGLTRSGANIMADGKVVMRLWRPLVTDAEDQTKERAIDYDFVTVGGQAYLLLTLPDILDMARPVIDPTLELQPAAVAGKDNFLRGYTADTLDYNYGTRTNLWTASTWGTILVEFDLSSIQANATCESATLYMYCDTKQGPTCTVTVYSVSAANADWVEGTQNGAAENGSSCWNKKAYGGASWAGSVGMKTSGTDYEASALGSFQHVLNDVAGTEYSTTLTAARIQQWFGGDTYNYGLEMFSDSTTQIYLSSSDNATAAKRPKLVVVYHVDASVTAVAAEATTEGLVPTVTGGAIVTAVMAEATAEGFVAVVTGEAGGGDTEIIAVIAEATAAGLVPTVTGGAATSGVLAEATAEAFVPGVTGGAGSTVPLAEAAAEALVPAVTGGAGVAGALAEAVAEALTPTVTGCAEVTAVMAEAVTEALVPAVMGGAGVPAVMAEATAEALAPDVTSGASTIGVLADATAEALTSTVTGGAAITGEIAEATAEALLPTVTGGAGVTGVLAEATAEAMTPGVTGGAEVVGAIAEATAEALLPTITGGATITAIIAEAVAEALIPTVSVPVGAEIIAAIAEASAEAIAPTITGDSATIAPIAEATAAALSPNVIGGAIIAAAIAEAMAEGLVPLHVGEITPIALTLAGRSLGLTLTTRLLLLILATRTLTFALDSRDLDLELSVRGLALTLPSK